MEERVKKDVIYIDVEDDITDVVGKIKDSKEKIVALVPPKSVGVLRSSINLRLLSKTSKKNGKTIVLVTSNSALLTMAAAAQIPVAKTLQSKPEVPEIDVLEIDGEDVIDGESLPVSEFAGKSEEEKEAEMLEDLDIDDNKSFSKVDVEDTKETRKKTAAIKIPNFNAFRKKIFIFSGLAAAVLIFFIWAIFFAPAAEVIISAKTSDVNISEKISLIAGASKVDFEKAVLPLKTEVLEKAEEVKFDATGTKELGEAASGTLKLSQSTESDGYSIKAGTAFSYGDCHFVTTEVATVSGFNSLVSGGQVTVGTGSGTVKIRATQIGEQCNIESGASFVSNISGLKAVSGTISGGVKKTIKIVSEEDVQKAKEKLSSVNNEEIKAELTAKFGSEYKIIDESFNVEGGDIEVSPTVGQEVEGQATARVKSKYSISAISKNDIEEYISKYVDSKIDLSEQQVYDGDSKKYELTDFNTGESKIRLTGAVKVGPKIDEAALKTQIKGKTYGEVQSKIESIAGVKDVDVKFSYFWVSKVPSDEKKITVKFTVE